MGFKIQVDGEEVFDVTSPVNRIGVATIKGVVTWINSQDVGFINLLVEKQNPGVVRLEQLEYANAQENAKIAQTVQVPVQTGTGPDRDLTKEDKEVDEDRKAEEEQQVADNTAAIDEYTSENQEDDVPEADANGIASPIDEYDPDSPSKVNEALEEADTTKDEDDSTASSDSL